MKTPTELDFKIYTKIHNDYDMSSPANFIISYINNGCDETYMDNELTELQCRAGAHRSFSDLYRLASTYFDTVDRLQLLYDLLLLTNLIALYVEISKASIYKRKTRRNYFYNSIYYREWSRVHL